MAVTLTSSSATTYVLQHLLRPPPPQPPPLLCFFLRPLCAATTTTSTATKAILSKSHKTPLQLSHAALFPSLSSLFTSTFLSSSHSLSFLLKAHNHSLSLEQEIEEDQQEQVEKDDDFCNGENGDEDEVEDTESGSVISDLEDRGAVVGNDDKGSVKEGLKKNGVKAPTLTVKEKKELASYAHGLGKKLKSQLVGKSGVTDNVASSFIETLEANELLKIKIHRTCPGELEDVVQRLEEATGSVVVGQIGRTVIIYRPSVSKMKAEEKKKQARRVFVRKEPRSKSLLQPRERVQRRLLGRGRRRSSSST